MLYFLNDYSEGAHEKVLQHLIDTNMEQLPGYGTDHYCEEAKEKIKKACGCEDAEVFLLTGGTQTNQIVIDTMLQPYEGVVAAQTGHVSTHEAGAIEFTGHKVLTLPEKNGKINAADLKNLIETFYGDENHEHMVFPGMVYISHPTEYGTLYTKKELTELSAVCREYKIPLFMDGARLIYGLVSKETDVTLYDGTPAPGARAMLAAAFLNEFWPLYRAGLRGGYLDEYRSRQALVGRQVLVTPRQGEPRQAAALGINDEWKLIVRFTGESRPTALNSGEVSVRLL